MTFLQTLETSAEVVQKQKAAQEQRERTEAIEANRVQYRQRVKDFKLALRLIGIENPTFPAELDDYASDVLNWKPTLRYERDGYIFLLFKADWREQSPRRNSESEPARFAFTIEIRKSDAPEQPKDVHYPTYIKAPTLPTLTIKPTVDIRFDGRLRTSPTHIDPANQDEVDGQRARWLKQFRDFDDQSAQYRKAVAGWAERVKAESAAALERRAQEEAALVRLREEREEAQRKRDERWSHENRERQEEHDRLVEEIAEAVKVSPEAFNLLVEKVAEAIRCQYD